MYRVLVIRLLWMIPALIAVSMIAFFLSRSIPGDPVDLFLSEDSSNLQYQTNFIERRSAYRQTAERLGLDRPLFYTSVQSHCLPDTLYRILRKQERRAAAKLALNCGNWDSVHRFRNTLFNLISPDFPGLDPDRHKPIQNFQNDFAFLLLEDDPMVIEARLEKLGADTSFMQSPFYRSSEWEELKAEASKLNFSKTGFLWWPRIVWHGSQNQYHSWIGAVLRGDFGISSRDSKPVFAKISNALQWTLLLNGFALLTAFIISLPLGVWLARSKRKKLVKWTRASLFALYAIPSFWLATIVVVFFTTPEYGAWLDLFPTQGLGSYRFAGSWFGKIKILTWHLFLPVFCLTVGSLAYISQQMKQSISHELKADYFLFYRSFGLKEKKVVWNHAFRNAIFPMITIFGGAIPVLFSGSLIIEVIFNIPGMGRLMYASILAKDWNVVFGVLLLISFITMISYLLTDIGYYLADPRTRSEIGLKRKGT